MFKALLIDLSGVLYEGDKAVPGAVEAIGKARSHGLQLRFITNTSRRPWQQLLQDLHSLGFAIHPDELFSAPVAARAWVLQHRLRPYCLIHEDLKPEFDGVDQSQPNAVIIGDAENNFSYQSLNRAFQLCQQGAPLIGIGDNRYFKLDGQLQLDAGPFIKAIEYAAGCEAVIMGKPAAAFFRQVLDSLDPPVQPVMMIGDDIYGDVHGAMEAGLAACLVKTGKYQAGDEGKLAKQHWVADSLVEAIALALESKEK